MGHPEQPEQPRFLRILTITNTAYPRTAKGIKTFKTEAIFPLQITGFQRDFIPLAGGLEGSALQRPSPYANPKIRPTWKISTAITHASAV